MMKKPTVLLRGLDIGMRRESKRESKAVSLFHEFGIPVLLALCWGGLMAHVLFLVTRP